MHIDQLWARFAEPLADDRPMPFWFWNDHLEPAEIERQIDDFADHGLGGFVLHPRIGLSREVGYLTAGWFACCRAACAAARRRGLKIILYDEGMYPSGASHGRVTRGRPELCARGLQRLSERFTGPLLRYHRAAAGEWMNDRIVAVTLTPLDGDVPRYEATRLLVPNARGLVRIEVGEGAWQLDLFLDVPTGGHSRGVHLGEDDNEAEAPPAADLLNPAAVARFLETTHEAYLAALGEYFGETVVAVFVDEPSLLGRGPLRGGLKPWTEELGRLLEERAGLGPRDLPALFDDRHPRAGELRGRYERVVGERLNETFYGPIAAWCEAHGLALVGHPERSDDLHALERYTWPGQDIVWRYIEPGRPSAMEGPHSTAARAATSAKRIWGRARAATECCGAYGWHLTAEELKGVVDWHLARGNDLILPHACYYSVRDARAYERPPCVGPNNVWWPEFRALADSFASLAALLRVGRPVVDTALACDPRHLPWRPAKILQERQIDFDYVPADAVDILARYAEVVAEPGVELPAGLRGVSPEAASRRVLAVQPEQPHLRAWRVRVGELTVYALFNEGDDDLAGQLELTPRGAVEAWDPWRRTRRPLGGVGGDGTVTVPLELERREVLVLVVDPSAEPAALEPPHRWRPAGEVTGWAWRPPGEAWQPTALGDWCAQRAWETFSGIVPYQARFRAPTAGHYRIDLGDVGEFARAWRGEPSRRRANWPQGSLGLRLGRPYRFELGPLAAGEEVILTIEVGNSKANELTGALRPSGLLGPVQLSVLA